MKAQIIEGITIHVCESCQVGGSKVEATTHSVNPEFSGYDLCEECAAEYDSRLETEDA